MTTLREQAAVLALVSATEGEWFRTAALVEEIGSALAVVEGDWDTLETVPPQLAEDLSKRVSSTDIDRFATQIAEWEARGLTLITILDDRYPANLRQIYNRSPFLFVRGQLAPEDDRSVAVVGTRNASEKGLQQARRLATDLANYGVTVLSGLARGIDTAAHRAALDASGRTVAVLGHGLLRPTYPPENNDLAGRIAETGALVSQFWPTAPQTRYTFPMRNVVMSGMGIGTVVIQAHGKSGARMQARLCLDHGKRLFLIKSLVMHEDWARAYAERPGVTVVQRVEDILDVLLAITGEPEQLVLC